MNRRARGQFLVEFVLSLTIWGALFAGLIALSRTVVFRMRAERLARFGTFLQATGRMDDASVLAQVQDFAALFGDGPVWNFELGRFLETPSSRFYRFVKTHVTAQGRGVPFSVGTTVVAQQQEVS